MGSHCNLRTKNLFQGIVTCSPQRSKDLFRGIVTAAPMRIRNLSQGFVTCIPREEGLWPPLPTQISDSFIDSI